MSRSTAINGARPPVVEVSASTASPNEPPSVDQPETPPKPVTLRTLQKMAQRGEKFACLTCYDATTARWLHRAGVPALLVGDTAAEMILGLPGTIHAPLDFLLAITAAVKRGAPGCFVIGDMPFMSYQTEVAEGMRNAGRFMTEGMADAVKLEVDRTDAALVDRMSRAGVPVIAHIGLRPQQAKVRGGYGAVGKTDADAQQYVADAAALQDAGAVMLLIEAVPAELAARIVEKVSIPVIGCGAGPACHGQVVVTQDLFGLTDWQPAFARPIANLGDQLIAAAQKWIAMVRDSQLGDHPYRMETSTSRNVDKSK